MRHSVHLARVISVLSGAHVQEVEQLNEQPVLHAGRNNVPNTA